MNALCDNSEEAMMLARAGYGMPGGMVPDLNDPAMMAAAMEMMANEGHLDMEGMMGAGGPPGMEMAQLEQPKLAH